MDPEFHILTEQDKKHTAYLLCVLGVTAAGATFGSVAGGLTVPGALGGAVMGLLMCRAVDDPLKRQLFDASARMTTQDFRLLAVQTARVNPRLSRGEVLNLLAAARISAVRAPGVYRC